MSVVGQGARASDSQKRARLRAAIEAGDQTTAIEIARQDLALVRNFANDMLKEIKPRLSLAARRAAIAAAPEEPIVHRELMRALILARKPEDVVAHAKSTPFEEPALRQLFLDVAEEFVAEGRPKQAIATLGAMQQSWPLNDDAKRVWLKAEILTGKPEQALERLDGFHVAPHERALLLQYLAARLEVQGDKAGALKCRRAAAAAVPREFRVVLDYLKSLNSMHDQPDRIIEALEDESFRDADKLALLSALRSETEGDQNVAKKLALHRATAELAPGNVTLVHEYVRMVLEEQGFDAALAALDYSAFDSADRVQVLRDLGGFLAKARKPDVALRCKAEAYKRTPHEFGPAYEIVSFLMSSGGPEAVRVYFSQDGRTPGSIIEVLARLEGHLIERDEQTVSRDCSRLILVLSPDDAANNARRAYPTIKVRRLEDFIETMKRAALTREQVAAIVAHLAELARRDDDAGIVAACAALMDIQ